MPRRTPENAYELRNPGLCPARAEDVGDLVGEVVRRRPAELAGHHDLMLAAAQADEPDPADRAGPVLDGLVVVLDGEAPSPGHGACPAPLRAVDPAPAPAGLCRQRGPAPWRRAQARTAHLLAPASGRPLGR